MVDSTSSPISIPVHDPNDKRPLPEIIAEHYGFPLAFADDTDGNRYYAVQDWIRGVTNTADPGDSWKHMKRRHPYLASFCKLLPYKASNGKIHAARYISLSGLLELTQRMG